MSEPRHLDPGRGFGRRLGLGERPALLVIDMIVGFTDPELPLGSELSGPLDATRRLLDAARAGGLPVYFSTVYYEEDGIWGRKIATLGSIRPGSPEAEVDFRLARRADEPVIAKKYPSVFFGTDLATRLVTSQADTLIVAGCTTSGCVRATVVDALSSGFVPIVVEEAVADRSQCAHSQSLIDMHDKYADVISIEEILSLLTPQAES